MRGWLSGWMAASLCVGLIAVPAWSDSEHRAEQRDRGAERPGRMDRGPMQRRMHGGGFDPQSVTTLTGVVAEGAAERGPLRLQTPEGEVAVQMAPPWYLQELGLALAAGDTVEVRGSMLDRPAGKWMVATEVTTGGRTLKLRDESGRPVWQAGRRAERQGARAAARGWRSAERATEAIDPAKLETFTGKVMPGSPMGHLRIQTDKGPVLVRLNPGALRSAGREIAAGEQVTVRGVPVTTVMAVELQHGEKVWREGDPPIRPGADEPPPDPQ